MSLAQPAVHGKKPDQQQQSLPRLMKNLKSFPLIYTVHVYSLLPEIPFCTCSFVVQLRSADLMAKIVIASFAQPSKHRAACTAVHDTQPGADAEIEKGALKLINIHLYRFSH